MMTANAPDRVCLISATSASRVNLVILWTFYGFRFSWLYQQPHRHASILLFKCMLTPSHEIPGVIPEDTWGIQGPQPNFWSWKLNQVSYYRIQFVLTPTKAEELRDYQHVLGNVCATENVVHLRTLHKGRLAVWCLWGSDWENNSS